MFRRLGPLVGLSLLLLVSGCTGREDRAITALTPELRPVVEANNALALDMYRELSQEQDDFIISPLTVTTTLGMVYAGAAGNTAAQFADLLQVEDPSSFHRNLGALSRDLTGEHRGRGYQLHQASHGWVQSDFALSEAYRSQLRDDYEVGFDSGDFVLHHELMTEQINGWVGDNTQGHIPELFAPGIIDEGTRMVLANALYFKADWFERFDKSETRPMPFTRGDGTEVMVDMMRTDGPFRVSYSDIQCSFIELDYQDEEVSMVIILPHSDTTLEEVESDLTAEIIAEALSDQDKNIKDLLFLPKMTLRSAVSQRDLMMKLGLIDPYTLAADLSKMVEPPAPVLMVDSQPHEVFIRIDEQGTEAAAASGSEQVPKSTRILYEVNRPFAFLIRDRLTGTFLMYGRVSAPQG